ncbi:MAG TPA: hypothetical protein VGH89_10060 [Pseudonocardia sp.]|jgi:hypothetical protein
MTKALLAVHVLAAIITVGPVTVAASMFPPSARRAMAGDGAEVGQLRTLHRICRVYALVGLVVPMFGLATAANLGILGETWLIVSIVLTAAAAAVLALLVLPRQHLILAGLSAAPEPDARLATRLAMHTGMFNLLWATVTVLMIIRPGSTTNV